jgi:hypothetical protein
MALSKQEIDHVFECLRGGMVPEKGLKTFAVGIEDALEEIHRQMRMVRAGEGRYKFLRGGYGSGKTFLSQLALLEALDNEFAVSKVVVSPNDMPFHKFDEVYSRILTSLRTSMAKSGALSDCIDKWISSVEDRLIGEGEDEDDPGFDIRVCRRFENELSELLQEDAGADFIAVIRTYFNLKQQGRVNEAMQLLSWLSGSKNIAAAVKHLAGLKGEISNQTAFIYLKGILAIIRKAGYAGLVINVDEMETTLRMRRDVREKSLNGLRQILDSMPEYKGLFWIFTGTPEFYDSGKGVASLQPLIDRIKFQKSGMYVNLKQPQLELKPFDKERLVQVGIKLRDIYDSEHHDRIQQRITDAFIHHLADDVTKGFGGDVGIVPRQFLREFVNVLDLVDQHAGYDPMTEYRFRPNNLKPEEEAALMGKRLSGDTVYHPRDMDW